VDPAAQKLNQNTKTAQRKKNYVFKEFTKSKATIQKKKIVMRLSLEDVFCSRNYNA
jgi:hypothetical protein